MFVLGPSDAVNYIAVGGRDSHLRIESPSFRQFDCHAVDEKTSAGVGDDATCAYLAAFDATAGERCVDFDQ